MIWSFGNRFVLSLSKNFKGRLYKVFNDNSVKFKNNSTHIQAFVMKHITIKLISVFVENCFFCMGGKRWGIQKMLFFLQSIWSVNINSRIIYEISKVYGYESRFWQPVIKPIDRKTHVFWSLWVHIVLYFTVRYMNISRNTFWKILCYPIPYVRYFNNRGCDFMNMYFRKLLSNSINVFNIIYWNVFKNMIWKICGVIGLLT